MATTMLLLLACTPPGPEDSAAPASDPEALLLAVAESHALALFPGVESAVEAQLGSVIIEDGGSRAGTLSLPEDAGARWEADADLTAAWAFTYTDDEGLRIWDWTIDLSLDALSLDRAELSGRGAWTVKREVYDYYYWTHGWSGTLSFDGADPVPVEWRAVAAADRINSLEGAIDGVAVSWENPEPDVP